MGKSESQRLGWGTASSASTTGREKDLVARFHERVGGFGASFRAGGKRGWTRAASRLATHLGRHLFLRGLDVSELAGRAVSLGVELLPFAGCGRARRGRGERGWAFVSRARRTGNRVHPRRKTRARCDTTSPHTWRLRVALLRVCLEVAARTFLLQPRLFGVGVRLHDARRVFHSARRTETFMRLPHRGADRAVRTAMLDPPPPPCRGPSFDPLSRTRRREVEVRAGCVRVVRRAVESARRAI